MGGTELIFELFSECHQKDSFNGLCISGVEQALPLIKILLTTMVIKILLTVITYVVPRPSLNCRVYSVRDSVLGLEFPPEFSFPL